MNKKEVLEIEYLCSSENKGLREKLKLSRQEDMYKGVTTSTKKMADKAIADWNRIRNAYSQSIQGTVTKKTVNKIIDYIDKKENSGDKL